MRSLRTNVFLLAAAILLGSASLAFAGVVINEVDYDQPGADEGDAAAPYVEGSGAGLTDSGSTGMDLMSIARVPNGADTDVNNVDFVFGAATPGVANGQDNPDCFEVIPVEIRSWGTVKGLYQD